MKNYIILRVWKNGKVKSATELNAEQLHDLKDYISDTFVNQSGGISIIIDLKY